MWKIFKNLKVTGKVVTAGLFYAVRAYVRFFRKRAKKDNGTSKKSKIFENLGKNVENFESILKKSRQMIVRNYILMELNISFKTNLPFM